MKARHSLAFALGALLAASTVQAQEDATAFIFGEYYVCDQNREAFSDQLSEYAFGPVLDRHLEAEHLIAWGVLSHRVGGEWRRAVYYASTDLNVLLDTRNAMIEEEQSDAELSEARRVWTDICPDHDDYIWSSVATSAPVTQVVDRPSSSHSVYFVCDVAREGRADEIFQEIFAPIYDRQVAAGKMNSWGWYSHVVGGKFRRLLVFEGQDHKTILEGLLGAITDIGNEAADAGTEFSSICNSHDDYLWAITLAKP